MSGRQPLPQPQPPKPTRPPFKSHQGKRKRPAGDSGDRDNVNGFVPPTNDRRPPRPKKQRKERKEKKEGDDSDNDAPKQPKQPQQPQLTPEEKKAKMKAKKLKNKLDRHSNNPNAVNEADLDYDLGLNKAVARMDAPAAAAYLARQTKRYASDLSEIELADLGVPAAAFVDASSYEKDRTLDNLADFLEDMAPVTETGRPGSKGKGKQIMQTAPEAKGAPHTIVVTGAGMRAADLVRAVRSFSTKNNFVAKLFAKHIKLSEAVSFLEGHRTGLAVGTPARLIDLLEQGALSVAHLRRIVVDASHIDQKKRGVLDMQDTTLPVVRWLSRPEFKARYSSGDEDGDEKPKDAPKPISILFY
ncbi:Protein cms1 [Sporothrix curviconia]|uniref:Protein cms1 n=1 Tax=Sporothrix curviconia TaxID=1260050 RepID=A0ABP0C0S0_9PEZI